MWNPSDPAFLIAVGVVAMLYSSVGHGGASGYIALMSMTALAGRPASTIALAMNLGVATISFAAFKRAKYFDPNLAWPFLIGSIPMAFVGGKLSVPGHVHKWLIAGALACAAAWLIAGAVRPAQALRPMNRPIAVVIGVFLGLLSGIVGVGGGIFLSPILVLAKWADAKQTASVSAVFIVLNSLAGLAARNSQELQQIGAHLPLVAAAIGGSLLGSATGAFKATNPQLRTVLGIVLLLAVIKLLSP